MSNTEGDVFEDDVPDDFFDDFSNKVFMQGLEDLDVLDVWENKSQSPVIKPSAKYNHGITFNDKVEKNNSKQILRRDPCKTKRDIERHKQQCEKNKATKDVKEKLRQVETGLVVPGMELDLELPIKHSSNEKCSDSRYDTDQRHKTTREEDRKRYDREHYKSKENPLSHRAHYTTTNSNDVTQDTRRSRKHGSSSPFRTSRRRVHSPEYRPGTRSPSRGRHSRRSGNDFEERATRLKRYSIDRKKSSSPRRQSFLEELDRKLDANSKSRRKSASRNSTEHRSILDNIREKINGVSETHTPSILQQQQPANYVMPHEQRMTYAMNQMCVPHLQTSNVIVPAYDPSNFVNIAINYPPPFSVPELSSNRMHLSNLGTPFVQAPNCMPFTHSTPNCVANVRQFPSQSMGHVSQDSSPLDKQDVDNVFNNKKISLSEFLDRTYKSTGHAGMHDMSRKLKVITRCQEAVRLLSRHNNLSGRFYYKPSIYIRNFNIGTQSKFKSPLKKQSIVRFKYTSQIEKCDLQKSVTSVHQLLKNLGLCINFSLSENILTKLCDPYPKNRIVNPNTPNEVSQNNQTECQTNQANRCGDCVSRNAKTFTSIGIQCELLKGNVPLSSDTLSPARAALKTLLQSQSLANLTSCQLLTQDSVTLGHEFSTT